LEDGVVDGRLMLEWELFVDWMHLAQDREQWRRAVVNTVMNLLIP
jgi:hypothetical protein